MPTIEHGLRRNYCVFDVASEAGESARDDMAGKATRFLVKRSRNVPRGWFVVRETQPKRSDWSFAYRRKTVVGDWREGSSTGRTPRHHQSVAIPETVEKAIASSRWILDLKDDWDEQGSPGYSDATWRRACDFLVHQANLARQGLGRELPAPKILPGPNASIDVHWKLPRFELLVNVPSDATKPPTCYGDDYGDWCIRGTLNTSEAIRRLVFWLLD